MALDQDLVKRNFLGRDGFIWWIGQIPAQENYQDNQLGRRETGETNGPGERFKVRIFGYHEIECGEPELADKDLPWAQVMYPVTAGGGGGGASQSANLTQGTLVYGFFLDGNDAQQPIIMGVLGYNQTAFSPVNKESVDKCNKGQPFDGYGPNDKVPITHIKEKPETVINPDTNPASSSGPSSIQSSSGSSSASSSGQSSSEPSSTKYSSGPSPTVNAPAAPTSSVIATAPVESAADTASKLKSEDGADPSPIKQPSRCNKNEGMNQIFTDVRKSIKKIQRLQATTNSWVTYVNGEIGDVQEDIDREYGELTKKITRYVKSTINKVRGYTINKIQAEAKKAYYLAIPNQDSKINKAQNTVMDTISCLFDKVVSGLIGLIGGAIRDLANKIVNATECLVEGLLGNILGNVLGNIVGGVQGILSSVTDIIGNIAGGVSGIVGAVIGFIENILAFGAAFTCQEDYSCAETEEWSIDKGLSDANDILSAPANLQSIAKNVTSQITDSVETLQGVGDQVRQAGENAVDSANSVVDSVKNTLSQFGGGCNVGPVPSGPPQLKISGGGGRDAKANAIIGDNGELLAVEVVDGGEGYNQPPHVVINDPTGAGNGAYLQTIIGPKEDDSDDDDIKSKTEGTDLVVVLSATPKNPPAGTTLSLSWNITSASGKEISIVNNNFGLENTAGTSGTVDINNFNQPKTFVLTATDGEDITTTSLRIVPKGQTGSGNNEVKEILVINSGYGYLKDNDGSWGANGGQWAGRCDTFIIDPEGNWLQPIPPGNVVTVLAGSQIQVPTSVTGYAEESDDDKDIDDGVSQENIFTPGDLQPVKETVTITTPKCPPPRDGDDLLDIGFGTGGDTEGSPSTGNGKYGVRLCLKSIHIKDSGANYGPDDEVYLEPDHGAKLELELGPFGSIQKVNVQQTGCGFRETPNVRINTRTGFNAELIPVFEVNRIGEADLEDIALASLDRDNRGIISVVDCVNQRYGKPDPSGSSADSGYYEQGKPNASIRDI